MKKLNIILVFTLLSLSCKAQHIIPVEKVVEYRNTNEGLLGDKDYVYVKDINNLLDKFVGTWKGIYESKNYEFEIIKITDDRGEVKEDMLLMRYKITDASGNLIENTLNLPNDNMYVIRGEYLAKTGSYVLDYMGKKGECGQNGTIFISANGNKMDLFLSVDGEIYPECTAGGSDQVLPVNGIELIKQ
ncbi:hypothetical protein JL193_08965 [Polaribacter batillariae]|uniref:DUF6705 domain-containing protein n=1 Tax=Polaribacter batillariae TaxID=2808900 RepID=A0ABX7SPZ3_9FLAO|nr:DUF6705 family protein [Polaribacter batillariae]QTD36295.1 hypothetical protein JL193_08965 [Polaribacter batillariae]